MSAHHLQAERALVESHLGLQVQPRLIGLHDPTEAKQ
jgi:hypothetical protein